MVAGGEVLTFMGWGGCGAGAVYGALPFGGVAGYAGGLVVLWVPKKFMVAARRLNMVDAFGFNGASAT